MQPLRKEGSLFAAPVSGLVEDYGAWCDCDAELDLEWGLSAVDLDTGFEHR